MCRTGKVRLIDLRKALPSGTPVSITALASWCVGDPWLEKLPQGTINEAVPMLFRMGPDGPNVASFLDGGNEFRVAACRGSMGLSTDESFSKEVLRSGSAGNSSGMPARSIASGPNMRSRTSTGLPWHPCGLDSMDISTVAPTLRPRKALKLCRICFQIGGAHATCNKHETNT